MRAFGDAGCRPGRDARRQRPRGASLFARAAAALVLLTVTMLAAAPGAPALITHLPGKTLSYEPAPNGAPRDSAPKAPAAPTPLTYHGGPVMTSNTNYAFYWRPSGGPPYPAGYEAGLNRYFEDVAHDSGGVQNTDSVLTQYGNSLGEFANYNSHFGGALIDTAPYPANGCNSAPICLTDAQLRAELRGYVEANKLPADLQHAYFILTPPGVESCFEAAGKSCSSGTKRKAYCAYHGQISITGGVIVYGNDPYVNGLNCDPGEEHPNGNPSDATIGGGLAHEHSEAVTNPQLNAWYDAKNREVGDKCRTFKEATEFGPALGKAPNGAKYNQVLNGNLYYYQQEWSNATSACEQRSAATPTVTNVKPTAGPKAGGTTVTLTGTRFTSPATVYFGTTPGTSVTVVSETSITVVSPASATIGTVNITVTTSAGTSAVNKKAHFKYKP